MSQALNIAAILFRNLGEALLKTAEEIGNGDQPKAIATIITQLPENPLSIPPPIPKLATRYLYRPREKVFVLFKGAMSPIKCRILKCISEDCYMVYPQGLSKEKSREVSREEILGIDPD